MSRFLPAGLVPLLLAAASLAGCGLVGSGGNEKPDLAHACQLLKCECRAAQSSIFSQTPPKPVDWAEDGTARCPEGYALARLN